MMKGLASAGAGRIVVGVDGSAFSRRALDWAVREAAVRGRPCLLVHCWEIRLGAAGPYGGAGYELAERAARESLDTDLAWAQESGIIVDARLVAGSAVDALAEATSDAELLVVGTHGRGSLTGAILGSVSSGCIRRATCAVVVVPRDARIR